MTVAAAMALRREPLLQLPKEGFDLVEVSFAIVGSKGCVKVRTNDYSVPVCPGAKVRALVRPAVVEIWYEGRCVATTSDATVGRCALSKCMLSEVEPHERGFARPTLIT